VFELLFHSFEFSPKILDEGLTLEFRVRIKNRLYKIKIKRHEIEVARNYHSFLKIFITKIV